MWLPRELYIKFEIRRLSVCNHVSVCFNRVFFPSLNTSLTAYIALQWSTLVILHGYNKGMDAAQVLPKLVEAQANLSSAAVASANKKLSRKVYTLLVHEWRMIKDIEVVYVENLMKLEIGNGAVILASLLIHYLVASKRNDLMEQLKVRRLNIAANQVPVVLDGLFVRR